MSEQPKQVMVTDAGILSLRVVETKRERLHAESSSAPPPPRKLLKLELESGAALLMDGRDCRKLSAKLLEFANQVDP